MPSDSPSISQEPSEVPSNVPSQSSAPSDVPSEVPSVSSAPSTVAFQAFQDRCDATSGGEGYVDCDGGFVNGDSSTSCATACGGQCCTGFRACNGFSGKGKSKLVPHFGRIAYTTHSFVLPSFL